MYDKSGAKLVQALEKRNMEGYYCPTAEEAVAKVLELIPWTIPCPGAAR